MADKQKRTSSRKRKVRTRGQGNRKIQDSFFIFIFNRPDEARELADTLGLDAREEKDVGLLSIRRIVSGGIEDDLAFYLGSNAIVLAEAQTTSPVNIPYRMLGYCFEVAAGYVAMRNGQGNTEVMNEYSSVKIRLPPFKLFAICPHLKMGNDWIHLYSNEFGEKDSSDLNIQVRIITEAPQDTLLGQYIAFCRKYKELCGQYENSDEVFEHLLKWSREYNILWKYIQTRESEVNEMLKTDYVMNKIKDAARFEGRIQGLAEGKAEGLAKGKAEGLAEGKAEGLAKGKAEGLAEGEKKARLKMTRELLRLKKITPDEAEDLFGLSQDEVKQLFRELEEESGSPLSA